jgi:hypothetical protein
VRGDREEAFNIFNHPMFGPIYNALYYGPTYFGYAYNTFNTQGNLNSLYQVGGPRSLNSACSSFPVRQVTNAVFMCRCFATSLTLTPVDP